MSTETKFQLRCTSAKNMLAEKMLYVALHSSASHCSPEKDIYKKRQDRFYVTISFNSPFRCNLRTLIYIYIYSYGNSEIYLYTCKRICKKSFLEHGYIFKSIWSNIVHSRVHAGLFFVTTGATTFVQ